MDHCSIPGCTRKLYGHGWCNTHYMRWRRNGDPLITKKPANGEAERFYREVVQNYSGDDCLIWPFAKTSGYAVLGRSQLHRRVCIEENGPPPTKSHQAAHSCGKGHLGCVNRHHLRWATPVENNADKRIHGTHIRGSLHGAAKITEEQAKLIMALKGKLSQPKIAQKFGIARSTVNNVHNGMCWAWLFD